MLSDHRGRLIEIRVNKTMDWASENVGPKIANKPDFKCSFRETIKRVAENTFDQFEKGEISPIKCCRMMFRMQHYELGLPLFNPFWGWRILEWRVRRLEKVGRKLPLKIRQKLANIFGVSPDDLLPITPASPAE